MTPLEGVVLSAGVAAAVGLAGAAGVLALGRRRPSAAAVLAPLVVVASVAAGVYASARAMFLSEQDSTTVLWLLLATVPVALVIGLALARRTHHLATERAAAVAARDRDREVEARRRELVAWVSHDLRTPLAAVRALAEAMEDEVTRPADAATGILAENRRMSDMVDDLLALSRLQSPGFELTRTPTDVGDLASDALAAAGPAAEAAGVRLTGEVAAPVVVPVDAREVARALGNLLSNAVRHTPAGGTVHVRVSTRDTDGPAAVVEVTDGCGGIPADDLPRVFEAGWRGTAARTPGSGGAGIGLSIVRSVAATHGGGVEVHNVELADGGGGCRFTLTLPA
ncbi:HAMP domain-containing sensor histidine kinase [Isoptericola sp. AK164]|uniref:sensor histidine kinase n=1 Tax=Isoptericola sp. AK164 TaxID=3024246 RepID=UPI0024185CDB|nr:HAMP domain-containing sensor histidine kinase [Isoptericola sp. AK164]